MIASFSVSWLSFKASWLYRVYILLSFCYTCCFSIDVQSWLFSFLFLIAEQTLQLPCTFWHVLVKCSLSSSRLLKFKFWSHYSGHLRPIWLHWLKCDDASLYLKVCWHLVHLNSCSFRSSITNLFTLVGADGYLQVGQVLFFWDQVVKHALQLRLLQVGHSLGSLATKKQMVQVKCSFRGLSACDGSIAIIWIGDL